MPLVFLVVTGLLVAWIALLFATTRLSAHGRGLHDRISGTSVVRITRG